jgi:hypothetical protein
MMSTQNDIQKAQIMAAPAPLVALAGWLVPGAGYWLIGHRARALTVGLTIIGLFVLGVLLAGMRVVEAPNLAGPGPLVSRILDRPWFIGQVLAGPLGLAAAGVSHWAAGSPTYAHLLSHSRLAEIGTLYTAVAGMLNLMAIIDATDRAGSGKKQD